MRRCRLILVGLVVVGLMAGGCGDNEAGETERPAITVFAASSTTEPVRRLARAYEQAHGTAVRVSFAGSSTLARQLAAGAEADVFLSANPQWMDYLQREEGLGEGSRLDLLGNRLVLVAPAGKEVDVRMARDFSIEKAFSGRMAIGDPSHVPAGVYAKQALRSLGWWDRLGDRLIPTRSVRAALRLVELGEAGVGVVYATDARASERVTVAGRFPDQTHEAIRYPVALSESAGAAGQRFVAHLQSDAGRAVFEEAGFVFLPAE